MKAKKYLTLNETKLCGIYFLFKAGKLIYIGQTIDLHSRLKTHAGTKRDFDVFRFIPCHPDQLSTYEKRLITYFKPCFNVIFIVQYPYTKLEDNEIRARKPSRPVKVKAIRPTIKVVYKEKIVYKVIKREPKPYTPILDNEHIKKANNRLMNSPFWNR